MEEQLKLLGNIIEFPKNRDSEKIKYEKQRIILHRLIDRLIDDNSEFEILINRENALKTFDESNELKDFLVITTNNEWRERLSTIKLKQSTYSFYVLNDDSRL